MNVESEYINPLTGKGWTDREEQIIAKVELEQGVSRTAAITSGNHMSLVYGCREQLLRLGDFIGT